MKTKLKDLSLTNDEGSLTNRTAKRTDDEPAVKELPQPWGWTAERRANQAAIIRLHQPWKKSTGPRTPAGKAASSRNAESTVRRHLRALKK